MTGEQIEKNERIKRFLSVLLGFAVVSAVFFFEKRMNAQNTTALALSYQYGLIPRGLVGTLLYVLKEFLGISLYSYRRVMCFTALVTICYYGILFAFYAICLKKTKEEHIKLSETVIAFVSIFMFTEFLTWNNFGRLDEYLMMITLLCLILLIWERGEWLLIPLCCIAGLVHVGFVFTNVGVILVLLLWKIFQKEGRERKKYIVLFAGCFLCVSVLFLYFEIFRQPLGMSEYEEIVALARSISEDGASISDSLLDSEILGLDVFEDEWVWHTKNYVETPIFLILFSPYLYIGIRFFKQLIGNAGNRKEKWKYIIVLLGAGTIVPELILKVDYGRWMFCIVAYYCLTIVALIALGDSYLTEQLKNTGRWLKEKCSFYWVLLIYPIIFVPFRDVYISDVTTRIMDFVAPILHIW